jgi:hypothetical protein
MKSTCRKLCLTARQGVVVVVVHMSHRYVEAMVLRGQGSRCEVAWAPWVALRLWHMKGGDTFVDAFLHSCTAQPKVCITERNADMLRCIFSWLTCSYCAVPMVQLQDLGGLLAYGVFTDYGADSRDSFASTNAEWRTWQRRLLRRSPPWTIWTAPSASLKAAPIMQRPHWRRLPFKSPVMIAAHVVRRSCTPMSPLPTHRSLSRHLK